MTDHASAGPVSQQSGAQPTQIWFDRRELDQILRTYGKMVAQGECRDYAIGAFADHALFCMYRRSSESPTWTVEKRPELARRQGAWSLTNATGHILKRGHELDQVLKVFEKKRFGVVG